MADNTSMNWDIELIPDEDNLFLRIHSNLLRFDFDFSEKKVPINVFRIHNEGMSVNWSKYSTYQKTLSEAREPEKNGVLEMNTGKIRHIPPLDVIHAPNTENRAHSNVINFPQKGPKKIKVRYNLSEISKWIILPKANLKK